MTPEPTRTTQSRSEDGWLAVELRQLAALAAVHEERSFRGAADQLGYVPSAVSQQVAQLERLVGARLVRRGRGHGPPVALTDAGLVLLEHGADIRARLGAAREALATPADGRRARLRLGAAPSEASGLLPEVLATLRRSAPEVVVEVAEVPLDTGLTDLVLAGELDAALGALGPQVGGLERVEVRDDPWVLLAATGSAWAAAPVPTDLRQLAAMPLIGPLPDVVALGLRAHGLAAPVVLRADDAATAQALVGAGCGAAILPGLAVATGDPAVVVRDVGALLPPRRLSLCWPADARAAGALTQLRDAALSAVAALAGVEGGHA